MSIRIQMAQTAGELRSLYEVRHRVFVEEEGYMVAGRLAAVADLYDSLPTTANLCAWVDGTLAGGVRITLDSEAGLPADDFFDFRSHLPFDAMVASCGMMCLTRGTRSNSRVIVSLLKMCMYWAVLNGVTHLYGPVNPKALGLVQRIGFQPVAEPFQSAEGLPSVPVVMDIERMARDYVEFTQRQGVGLWMENFVRQLYEIGDVIMRAGEVGNEAFLLVEGSVEVYDTSGALVAVLQRGHVFGELSLLELRSRTHTVVAAEPTDVMVLPREQFREQLRTNPDVATELIRSLGNRFEAKTLALASAGPSARRTG